MGAKHGKSTHGLICELSRFLLLGVFFLAGCSQQTASKPQEATAPQKVEAKQAPSKATLAKQQDSSLEAAQKGTKAGTGPLEDVNFDFDRYDVRPDAREILKKHAAWLKANPQVSVEIEGHCDERGTTEYNLALGAKRADAVKKYVIDLGIPPSRLETVSYGKELLICKESNENCWAKNRRVHFVVRAAATN
jgi:peptidoglycan-associated lipoprotein